MDLMQWKARDKSDEGFGADGERLEPERGSLWPGGIKAGEREMRARQGRDLMSFTHVHMRVAVHVSELAREEIHTPFFFFHLVFKHIRRKRRLWKINGIKKN